MEKLEQKKEYYASNDANINKLFELVKQQQEVIYQLQLALCHTQMKLQQHGIKA